MPKRIQRKRARGWRMPAGAIYVGRPSRWGNPFAVGERVDGHYFPGVHGRTPADAAEAVEWFRRSLHREILKDNGCAGRSLDALLELRGHDLACWCPLDQPCHADVLLELANLDMARAVEKPDGATVQ